MPRRPPLALLLVAPLALAAGCAGAGEPSDAAPVAAVNGLPAKALLACRGLKGSLPAEVAPGARTRAATPLSDSTAAWGDPPVTLRCGVPEGSSRDDPYEFNGVRWAMHDTGASRTWTTLGLKVNVAVEVPDAYSSQAELLGRLSGPVSAHLR